MLRGALAVVVFLAGLIAGAAATATASHAATTAAPTQVPTPAFARYTALDLVALFNSYGLYAESPHIPTNDTFSQVYPDAPLSGGQARSFMDSGTGASSSGLGYVVACSSQAELNAVWTYLLIHPANGALLRRSTLLHNANLILVFFWFGNNAPDYTLYQAAFIAMRQP